MPCPASSVPMLGCCGEIIVPFEKLQFQIVLVTVTAQPTGTKNINYVQMAVDRAAAIAAEYDFLGTWSSSLVVGVTLAEATETSREVSESILPGASIDRLRAESRANAQTNGPAPSITSNVSSARGTFQKIRARGQRFIATADFELGSATRTFNCSSRLSPPPYTTAGETYEFTLMPGVAAVSSLGFQQIAFGSWDASVGHHLAWHPSVVPFISGC